METVDGDLLDAEEQYLVHQTNCLTIRAAHLSASVFRRFPHADIYAERGREGVTRDGGLRHVPGTLEVRGGGAGVGAGAGEGKRLVINLLGQLGPGKPAGYRAIAGVGRLPDSQLLRQQWFREGLIAIGALPGVTSVALPHGIGCGAAGGDWAAYSAMIEAFAHAHSHIRVRIYRLPSAGAGAETC